MGNYSICFNVRIIHHPYSFTVTVNAIRLNSKFKHPFFFRIYSTILLMYYCIARKNIWYIIYFLCPASTSRSSRGVWVLVCKYLDKTFFRRLPLKNWKHLLLLAGNGLFISFFHAIQYMVLIILKIIIFELTLQSYDVLHDDG